MKEKNIQRKLFFKHLRRLFEHYDPENIVIAEIIHSRLDETILTAYVCNIISENTHNILYGMISNLR